MRPWRYWKKDMFEILLVRPCAICGIKLTRQEATVDHIIPRSLGGLNTADNYQITCKPCNDRKGNGSLGSILVSDKFIAELPIMNNN